jgi:hypothetical protein
MGSFPHLGSPDASSIHSDASMVPQLHEISHRTSTIPWYALVLSSDSFKLRHHHNTFLRHPSWLLSTLANLNTRPDRDFSLLTPFDLGSVDHTTMCNFTKVEYCCCHLRYTVRAWCDRYRQTHRRCPPNVVAV